MATTMIRRREEMTRKPLPNCHEGKGALDWTNVLGGEHLARGALNWLHDDVLPPGVTIGVHPHKDDEEYYYILSGRGVMILDGQRHSVKAGDITAVFPGGSHGLENTSDENLRAIVISVKAAS
jgi:mannose-6-phosphate isomerase-like protein (cupin superfamily)